MTILHHIFAHILITDCCLFRLDSFFFQSTVQTNIRHNSCHHCIVCQLPMLLHISSTDIHDSITVDNISLFIHSNTAIRIPVIGKACIHFMILYKICQHFNMGRTTIRIDIRSIRFIVDDQCLCSQCIKHILCNRRSTSVGTVQCHRLILKRSCCNGNQITDITVPSCSKIHGSSDIFPYRKRNFRCNAIDILLYLILDFCFHLHACPVNQLDPIVIEWIMTG